MTSPLSLPPSDDELDALLARRYRDTSPEFEARWVALKRELRQTPPRRHVPWWSYAGWLGAGATAAALAFFLVGPGEPVPPELTPQLRELFALDAALAPARPLLDEDARLVLLNLPPEASTRH